MLIRASNGSYEFVDFRETAPAAAFQDMFKGNIDASETTGLAREGLSAILSRYKVLTKTQAVFLESCAGFSTFTTTTLAFLGGILYAPRSKSPVRASV